MNGRTSCIRIGFIGAGGIAERHADCLGQMDDVEIVAFADPDFTRADRLGSRLGARAYRSHQNLLEREKLDAVYICVPPFAHGEPEHAVLRAGLPFFVEKPLSLALSTAEAIARAIAEQGLITASGYHWRYLDTVDEARGLLATNSPQLVSGYWLDQTPSPPWWRRRDRSGGQIVEQATHIIDLARHIVGEVSEVYAQASHAVPRPDFPDLDVATATSVGLRFASGAVGNLATTCLLRWGHRIGLHVFADGLAIELSDREIMVDVGRGRLPRQVGQDPVYREDRDFIDAVLGFPNRIRCPYAEALKTHRVAIAISRSEQTGTPVVLDMHKKETAAV